MKVAIADFPQRLARSVRRLNARLLPPDRYVDGVMLGLSAVEETYFVAKNFVDAAVHLTGQLLYENDYFERRLKEYSGQKRLVVLIPGYMQTHLSVYRLERHLGNEVFGAFTFIWSDFPYSQDILLSARALVSLLRRLREQTQVEEIFLVGHSQGGLIIRTLVQHGLHGDLPVKKCLFLSTPHQGTWIALTTIAHGALRRAAGMLPYVTKVRGESGYQLLPNSRFIRRLNALPLPEKIAFCSIYYAFDPMIWPPHHAVLPYAEAQNHFINKVGHAQPLYCSRALQVAIKFLYGAPAQRVDDRQPIADLS